MIPVNNMDDALRDLHYQVNMVGTWNCVKAFLPHMIERKYGRILNMSSVTGPRVVDPGMMGYAMSKGAISAFTKAIAMDVAKYGITSNAILPGYFLTPMVMHSAQETDPENPQRVLDGIAAGVPLGRFGKPEEIGYLAAFLASDEAAYFTGQEFVHRRRRRPAGDQRHGRCQRLSPQNNSRQPPKDSPSVAGGFSSGFPRQCKG